MTVKTIKEGIEKVYNLFERDGTQYFDGKEEIDGKKIYYRKKAYCWKCGGRGYGHWHQDGGICYACRGTGGEHIERIRLYTEIELNKINARAEAARQEKIMKKAAELANKKTVFLTKYGSLFERAEAVKNDNDFIGQLVHRFETSGNLTERQITALDSAVVKVETLKARLPAGDAPKGRAMVSGVVLSTKVQTSRFGTQLKMLVELENFSKVYGAVSSKLYNSEAAKAKGTVKGLTIKFEADFERSPDDAKFAFYKRPIKIEVIEDESNV